MAKMIRYEIERRTHGIDRYYVELMPDEDQSPERAIQLVQSGEVPLDFHADDDWGQYTITDKDEVECDDEEEG